MLNSIKTAVQEFGWIHTGIGLCGNVLFLLGSIAFLPSLTLVQMPWGAVVEWQTVGVWLFITGAALMAVGSLGSLLVQVYEAQARRQSADDRSRSGAG